jgi:hypothetical protein
VPWVFMGNAAKGGLYMDLDTLEGPSPMHLKFQYAEEPPQLLRRLG